MGFGILIILTFQLWPNNSNLRIVPSQTAFIIRMIEIIALIAKLGKVGKDKERIADILEGTEYTPWNP